MFLMLRLQVKSVHSSQVHVLLSKQKKIWSIPKLKKIILRSHQENGNFKNVSSLKKISIKATSREQTFNELRHDFQNCVIATSYPFRMFLFWLYDSNNCEKASLFKFKFFQPYINSSKSLNLYRIKIPFDH